MSAALTTARLVIEPVARPLERVGKRRESRQVDSDFFKGTWSVIDGHAILASEHRAG